jgi:Domain of unknown function (DUF6457)
VIAVLALYQCDSEVSWTVADRRGELIDAVADLADTRRLTEPEIESVLALAAVAAHSTGDRTTAPLASFLAGIAAAGVEDRTAMLDDLRRHVAELGGAASED